jgi:hypothetical protein
MLMHAVAQTAAARRQKGRSDDEGIGSIVSERSPPDKPSACVSA